MVVNDIEIPNKCRIYSSNTNTYLMHNISSIEENRFISFIFNIKNI